MKKILFAIGALALGLTATAPAHADFAIVKFNSGYAAFGLTLSWRLQMERSSGLYGGTTATTTCRPCQSPSTN